MVDLEKILEDERARFRQMESYYKAELDRKNSDISDLKELLELEGGHGQVTSPGKKAKCDDSLLDSPM